jgi:phosphatidylglycerol:prolipoprotein diacylglycerol transferase
MIMGIACLLGLSWMYIGPPEKEKSEIFDMSIITLICALLGSRLGFVIINWDYYEKDWIASINIAQGGLTWAGALTSGLLGLGFCSIRYHRSFGYLLDQTMKLYIVIFAAAWLASIFEGCSYSILSDSLWAMPVRDESGMIAKRFPLQILAILVSLTWYWLLENWQARSEKSSWNQLPGMFGYIVLAGLMFQLFWLSFLRADPSPIFSGWRLESWIASGLCFIFMMILILKSGCLKHLVSRKIESKVRST